MAHAFHLSTVFPTTLKREEGSVTSRLPPTLSAEDIKALDCIRTSGAFTLEKSIGMYADVKRLRPKNAK